MSQSDDVNHDDNQPKHNLAIQYNAPHKKLPILKGHCLQPNQNQSSNVEFVKRLSIKIPIQLIIN